MECIKPKCENEALENSNYCADCMPSDRDIVFEWKHHQSEIRRKREEDDDDENQ